MDYRGQHQEGTGAAIDAVGVFQERLAMATEQADMALGCIIAAAGDPPEVESGRNAFEAIAAAKERIEESNSLADRAIAELQRYAGGF